MHLDISEPECDLLIEILQGYRGDLRSEIHCTDNPSYKKELKEEEALLDGLLNRLHALKPAAPAA